MENSAPEAACGTTEVNHDDIDCADSENKHALLYHSKVRLLLCLCDETPDESNLWEKWVIGLTAPGHSPSR